MKSWPFEFKHVAQPPDSFLCGACVAAMVLGKTLDEVLAEVDWRKLIYTHHMVQYLASHDVFLGLWLTIDGPEPVAGPPRSVSIKLPTLDRPAIAVVASKLYPDLEHWVLWTGREILDSQVPPGSPPQTYMFKELLLLMYAPTVCEDLELPEDWRSEECLAKVRAWQEVRLSTDE